MTAAYAEQANAWQVGGRISTLKLRNRINALFWKSGINWAIVMSAMGVALLQLQRFSPQQER